MNKDQKSALSAAGFKPSSDDPNRYINTNNNHWIKDNGNNGIIVSTSRHNKYGSDLPAGRLSDRLNK